MALALGCIFSGIGFYWWLLQLNPTDPQTEPLTAWGLRGDAVAPFNALLTAFALFAGLFSVHMQGRELALQRKELKLQRQEMKESRLVQEQQQAAQDRLAKAQESANQLTANLVHAQQAGNNLTHDLIRAQKISALATLRSAWATAVTTRPGHNHHGTINIEIRRLEEELGLKPVVTKSRSPTQKPED